MHLRWRAGSPLLFRSVILAALDHVPTHICAQGEALIACGEWSEALTEFDSTAPVQSNTY